MFSFLFKLYPWDLRTVGVSIWLLTAWVVSDGWSLLHTRARISPSLRHVTRDTWHISRIYSLTKSPALSEHCAMSQYLPCHAPAPAHITHHNTKSASLYYFTKKQKLYFIQTGSGKNSRNLIFKGFVTTKLKDILIWGVPKLSTSSRNSQEEY